MSPFHIYLYGPSTGPLDTSFEQASARLLKLQSVGFEPDGSFVVSRDHAELTNHAAQQIFGMLYDAGGQLQYVELRGTCTQQLWHEVLDAIVGSQNTDLAVMLLPERQLQTLQNFEKDAFRT